MTTDDPRNSSARRFEDAHLAAIVNSTSDAIVSKDVDGTILSWNAGAERIFGYSADEIVGQSIRILIPPDRQSEEDEILARIRAGERVPNFRTWRLHKDGTLIPIAVTVSPLLDEDGAVVGASKIAHDIRNQHELEARLRDSERRFHLMADNIPQLAWMADPKGWIFWYNQRWFDYTGTTLEEMKGWGWQKIHHPDHVERVTAGIQKAWDSGDPWEDIFPLRSADGEYRWFLSRASPLRDDDGAVALWFGTNTDVTQQRENERQIELLMREVNHRAKNMLSVVQALVRRTAGDADAAFVRGLERRIEALSINQDLLIERDWKGAKLEKVIRSQIEPAEDKGRVALSGPDNIMLRPNIAECIGLAMHELAINAVKYGALSDGGGSVDIAWSVLDATEGGRPRFRLSWREKDGPAVEQPQRRGFGTTLIEANPRMILNADVALDYAETGLSWSLECDLDRIVQD